LVVQKGLKKLRDEGGGETDFPGGMASHLDLENALSVDDVGKTNAQVKENGGKKERANLREGCQVI